MCSPQRSLPIIPNAQAKDELLRVAVYVCMHPAATVSAEARRRRRLAFAIRTGTTHWADKFVDAWTLEKSGVDDAQVAKALRSASQACRDLIG